MANSQQKVFIVGELKKAEIKKSEGKYEILDYGVKLKNGGYITIGKYRSLEREESPKFAQWMEESKMELKRMQKKLSKDEEVFIQLYIAPSKDGKQYDTLQHNVTDDGKKFLQASGIPKEIDKDEYDGKNYSINVDMFLVDKSPFDGELKLTTGGDYESILYINIPDDKFGVMEKLNIGKGYRVSCRYEKGQKVENVVSDETEDTLDKFFEDEEIDQSESNVKFAPDVLMATKIKPIKDMVLEGMEEEEDDSTEKLL